MCPIMNTAQGFVRKKVGDEEGEEKEDNEA